MYMNQMIENSLMGLFVGDALGAQVEFKSNEQIDRYFSDRGGLDLYPGGTFNLERGQVTDDSEMAISLIRSFDNIYKYNSKITYDWYCKWLKTNPFDFGNITYYALNYNAKNYASEANGALMRCAPISLKYYKRDIDEVMKIAEEDCKITHPNKICVDVNKIYLAIMYYTINHESMRNVYKIITSKEFIEKYDISADIVSLVVKSTESAPDNFTTNMGWVKIAFQNALYHYWNETEFYDAMEETIYSGGDTDTNACICGALIGLRKEIPESWINIIQSCSPKNRPSWLWTSRYQELLDILS